MPVEDRFEAEAMGDDVAPRGDPGVTDVIRRLFALVVPDAVDDAASLFALGGDSVAAVRIFSAIQEFYGVVLDPEAAFEDPSVTGLARMVETALLEHVLTLTDAQADALLADLDGRAPIDVDTLLRM